MLSWFLKAEEVFKKVFKRNIFLKYRILFKKLRFRANKVDKADGKKQDIR